MSSPASQPKKKECPEKDDFSSSLSWWVQLAKIKLVPDPPLSPVRNPIRQHECKAAWWSQSTGGDRPSQCAAAPRRESTETQQRGDQMGRTQIFWNESGELGAIKQNTLKVRGNEQTEENRGYKLWKQSETELLFLCDVYVLSLFANCYYLGQHLLVLDDVLIGGK